MIWNFVLLVMMAIEAPGWLFWVWLFCVGCKLILALLLGQ